MKKLLIGSVALLTIALLAVAGLALLGPDGALAQDSEDSDSAIEHRFSPLDEVLDELVEEDVIDRDQADAIRDRMTEKMQSIGDGFHFRMEGFLDELPEGITAPPGPPGTEEFDQWLEEMRELMGDEFFGGHMFEFRGELPEDGFFHFRGPDRMGPGMGEGFREFHGFGDFDAEDLERFIDEMTERFDDELPERIQDMIDHLREQVSDIAGTETSIDA